MPVLQAQWQATAVAARSLDADLGQSLEQVLRKALVALEQRPSHSACRTPALRRYCSAAISISLRNVQLPLATRSSSVALRSQGAASTYSSSVEPITPD